MHSHAKELMEPSIFRRIIPELELELELNFIVDLSSYVKEKKMKASEM